MATNWKNTENKKQVPIFALSSLILFINTSIDLFLGYFPESLMIIQKRSVKGLMRSLLAKLYLLVILVKIWLALFGTRDARSEITDKGLNVNKIWLVLQFTNRLLLFMFLWSFLHFSLAWISTWSFKEEQQQDTKDRWNRPLYGRQCSTGSEGTPNMSFIWILFKLISYYSLPFINHPNQLAFRTCHQAAGRKLGILALESCWH